MTVISEFVMAVISKRDNGQHRIQVAEKNALGAVTAPGWGELGGGK